MSSLADTIRREDAEAREALAKIDAQFVIELDGRELQIMTAFEHPPIPVRDFDWSAWIDGREEWLTGRGRTEAAAIADLREQIEEADEAQDAPAPKPAVSECGAWTVEVIG
jgi:hypothetical protein